MLRLRSTIQIPGSTTLEGFDQVLSDLRGFGTVKQDHPRTLTFEWEPGIPAQPDGLPEFVLAIVHEHHPKLVERLGIQHPVEHIVSAVDSARSTWDEIETVLKLNGIETWTQPERVDIKIEEGDTVHIAEDYDVIPFVVERVERRANSNDDLLLGNRGETQCRRIEAELVKKGKS